ncbi:MAG: hypothetical protein IK081_07250 [Lachnospiraceae bacterium]|nr:hypothetical protein [Lachnospiraceae bacterium]
MGEELKLKRINCPNCGAAVTSETCPYCGSRTGIDTADAELDYPEFIGKDLTDVTGKFFIRFGALWEGITLGMQIFLIILDAMISQDIGFYFKYVYCGVFHLIGIACLAVGIRQYRERSAVEKDGKTVSGICHGLTTENVKLLIPTENGLKYLFFHGKEEYGQILINDEIKIKALGNKFIVLR